MTKQRKSKGLEFPNFSVDWENRHGILREPYTIETPITGYSAIADDHSVKLTPHGRLTCGVGFRWDFGSGPAFNNKAMIVASIAHDAVYYLIAAGKLPKELRRRSDKFLRQQLLAAGASPVRAWYVWAAVRVGYPLFKILGFGKSVHGN